MHIFFFPLSQERVRACGRGRDRASSAALFQWSFTDERWKSLRLLPLAGYDKAAGLAAPRAAAGSGGPGPAGPVRPGARRLLLLRGPQDGPGRRREASQAQAWA